MDKIDISSVLQQMRVLRAEAQNQVFNDDNINRENNNIDFGQVLKTAIDKVNETQKTAGELAKAYEQGQEGVDLVRVMVAMQKSSVSFQAMTEVRNKLLTAYKEIMNMPV